MDGKKALKTIPAPKVNLEQIRKAATRDKNIRGVIISQKKKIGAEETLILNVYQASGKNKKDISLLFRVKLIATSGEQERCYI